MLLTFAVTNYRSIYERQELTFIAAKYNGLEEALLSASVSKDARVLPVLAVYGSNAAGKTNLLRAIHFLESAISRSQDTWKLEEPIPYMPHFFHADEPSTIEAEFVVEKLIFKYVITFNRESFLSETLHQGRELQFRRVGRRYKLGEHFKAYDSAKRITRKNSLFLSACAQNNHPISRKIRNWFTNWHTVTDDRTMEEAFTGFLLEREAIRKFLASALSAVNPSIVEVRPGKEAVELRSLDDSTAAMMKDYSKWISTEIVHSDGKKKATLRLGQESRGTQSYFALASSILLTLASGGLFILDEADQSLHPMLLKSLVTLFQKKRTNPKKAQLIFNTHDTTLLSPGVLRPDQVWFVEMEEHASKVFCLADFEGIRSDTKAQKAYLDGRFGAIPFLERHEEIFADNLSVPLKAK